jgi:hypothetical protein
MDIGDRIEGVIAKKVLAVICEIGKESEWSYTVLAMNKMWWVK